MNFRVGPLTAALAAAVALNGGAQARLTRLVVEKETAIAATPTVPAYRILRGHYDGELDPADPRNALITDLARAPRTMRGRVAYRATFQIALPTDPARLSGFLWYDVPNRGNGGVAPSAEGNIAVVSGWQGDIAPGTGLQNLEAPVATGLTAPVLQQFTNMPAGTASIRIGGGLGGTTARPAPVSMDPAKARLFHQASDTAPRIDVPSSDWAFADCRTTPFPGTPDPAHLCLKGGFDRTQAYTLVYQGKDPIVLGIGFAAVRDLNSFLRYRTVDDAGTANPIAGLVRWSLVMGTSQSGNFVRSFIALGFNQDEDGRRVFDGANPNIAARQLPLNIRFAVPGGAAGPFEPGSEGPLWWSSYDDRARGRGTASLLDRCRTTDTCPKIFETFGSAEFWGLRMSPGLVGTDARRDLPLPAEVRRYYFPSVTHGGSARGGFPPKGEPSFSAAGRCVLAGNPNPSSDTRRALLKALEAWVSVGRAPPPSRYPMLADGALVPPTDAAIGWPPIPGTPSPEGKLNRLMDQDFGRGFDYRNFSGVISRQPPHLRRIIPSRVPRVNSDGNETDGIPSVQLLVPIGTYTGWNELADGYGKGGGCSFTGGFIPFARDEIERAATKDPRPSLEARYHNHAGFVMRVRSVADDQVKQGWLLPADAAHIIREAEDSTVLR